MDKLYVQLLKKKIRIIMMKMDVKLIVNINNYLNQNHSNKSHAHNDRNNNGPFSIQIDRSRRIIVHDIEPIEPSNIWNDNDSISTMNTMHYST